MSRITSIAFSAALIGSGALAWSFAGRPLLANPDANVPLNPLGINRSPYGEVFAMAMQGPIDSDFRGVMGGGPVHHQASDAISETDRNAAGDKTSPASNNRFRNLLTFLETAQAIRTNPKSPSEAHKLYLRRQVENKLRFTYQLDPSHYANYNSLHFFLTEPQLGTRPELTPSAAKLAEDTIAYCLKQDNDPRPTLTAAAAASNILELMFNDRQNPSPRFSTAQMRQYLEVLDSCIRRYVILAKQWDDSKNWDLLSPQRITECDERFNFICKFRESAFGTIARIETNSHQVAN